MLKNIFFESINYRIIIFIFFSFSFAGEISNHYLGASLDIASGNATFIDKIKITANPHWVFSLSSDVEITSIKLNNVEREYYKLTSGPSRTEYKIKRKLWEPREALISIQYRTLNSVLFKDLIIGKLVQLKASELFYPKGFEFSSNFEFHIQIPKNWKLISDGNVSKLKGKQDSYKISSTNKITELNLFFLKNYDETPQLDRLLLSIYSMDLTKSDKESLIKYFFESLSKIENLLGTFPFPKFDIVFTDYNFESGSIIITDYLSLIEDKDKFSNILISQYFNHYLFSDISENLNWFFAIESYLLDYLPMLEKSEKSAKIFRKEILNLNAKSIIHSKLKKYSEDFLDQYAIQTYLFLLFSLENQFGEKYLLDKIQNLIQNFAWKKIDKFDTYSYLLDDFNINLEFYLDERFSNLDEQPVFEIIESEKAISILQPEKVLPMLIPIKYYYTDSSVKDTTIFTKSFKTPILNKLDTNIEKIEVDPDYYCFRTLNNTEIESKIKNIFNYESFQVSISSQFENTDRIKEKLNLQFSNSIIEYKTIEELNSNIPSIIIGELPLEFKYLSTNTDIILNGRKFYLKNHCIAYAFNNQFNNTNLIIYTKSEEQLIPVIEKLKFFKNYGYYILRNGNNAGKGSHKTHSKHLVWEKK